MVNFIFAFFLGILALVHPFPDNHLDELHTEAPVKVYVFLHEDCLISQYYTLSLKELHEEYASDSIIFEGIFPNESSTSSGMQGFKEKYTIPFALKKDKEQSLSLRFGAQITPEVVVYQTENKKILYRGRIDNSYYQIGRRRRVVTTSELKDVLEALINNNPISTKNTPAVGCFIEQR